MSSERMQLLDCQGGACRQWGEVGWGGVGFTFTALAAGRKAKMPSLVASLSSWSAVRDCRKKPCRPVAEVALSKSPVTTPRTVTCEAAAPPADSAVRGRQS